MMSGTEKEQDELSEGTGEPQQALLVYELLIAISG
jgi:hypothetical protein